MKFTIAALVSTVALAATVADAAAPKCSGGVRVRKEFRDLSAGEWSLYVSAIHTLAKKPANDGRLAKKGYSILEELVKIHVDNFGQIHDNDIFPTWHRAFIYRFETELRKVDASISLPYWAITADYEHPENAYAFSDKILGGSNPLNKQLEAGCIKNGPFQDLKYRDFGCIRRGFDAQGHVSQSIAEHNLADQFWDSTYKARLPSGPEVEAILRNAGGSWAKFLDDFNYVLHASVHSFIAGSDSGTMINQHSPADPGFWFWHAWMDSVFTEWQRRNPAAAVPYLNQGLPGLGLSAGSVHSVVDMCYSYQPAGCLNPKPVPTSTSTTTTKSTSTSTSTKPTTTSTSTSTSTSTKPTTTSTSTSSSTKAASTSTSTSTTSSSSSSSKPYSTSTSTSTTTTATSTSTKPTSTSTSTASSTSTKPTSTSTTSSTTSATEGTKSASTSASSTKSDGYTSSSKAASSSSSSSATTGTTSAVSSASTTPASSSATESTSSSAGGAYKKKTSSTTGTTTSTGTGTEKSSTTTGTATTTGGAYSKKSTTTGTTTGTETEKSSTATTGTETETSSTTGGAYTKKTTATDSEKPESTTAKTTIGKPVPTYAKHFTLPKLPGYPVPPTDYPSYVVRPVPPTDRSLPRLDKKMAAMMGYNYTKVVACQKKFEAVTKQVVDQVNSGTWVPSFGQTPETRNLLGSLYTTEADNANKAAAAIGAAPQGSGAEVNAKAWSVSLVAGAAFVAAFL